MNNSTAIFLINDDIRAIRCAYEVDAENNPAKRETFKTFDKSIEVGDYLIVESGTRHNMTVVQVKEVDYEIDFDSHVDVKWVVGKIELDDFEKMKAQEQQFLDAVKSAEKARKRRELRDNLVKDHEEQISKLPIAHITDDVPVAATG